MLEPPAVDTGILLDNLDAHYGICATALDFLPLGVDVNAAVYRVATDGGAPYFLKLRRGAFAPIAVTLPAYLHGQGIRQVIQPVSTRDGRYHAAIGEFTAILYPFVEGRSGGDVQLSVQQWAEFGRALRRVHSTVLPPALRNQLAQEEFSPRWRAATVHYLERAATEHFADPAAAALSAFLHARRGDVLDLVERAARNAVLLQARALDFVVCHADIHAWNLLVEERGAVYIVDWDAPILAPKERDLMFIGGGLGFVGVTPAEEIDLFYRGYGVVEPDPTALAYYRYERIVEDIAAYCAQLLDSGDGGADRGQALAYVKSNFLPGGTIERAQAADRRGHGG